MRNKQKNTCLNAALIQDRKMKHFVIDGRLRSGRVGWRLAAAFLVTLWVLGRHSGSYQEVAGTGRLWKALIVRSLIISCKWRAIEMFTLLYYIKTAFLKNSMKYLNKYFTRIIRSYFIIYMSKETNLPQNWTSSLKLGWIRPSCLLRTLIPN